MENILSLLIPIVLVIVLIRIIMAPMKLIWKLFINSGCGFLCLWLLNSIAGFTGIVFPVNVVTILIAGFLGLPGIVLMALAQFFL